MRQPFHLLLCALLLSLQGHAQTLSQSRGPFGQIYRLTDAEAAAWLRVENTSPFQESWLHTPVDTFHGLQPARPLPPGHHLLAKASGEQIDLELRSVYSINILLLPHPRDFLLAVTDRSGAPVRDARVLLRGKQAPFDSALQCYRLSRRSRGGFVEVYAAGESWFGHLNNDAGKNTWRRRLNYHTSRGPLRILSFPVRWTYIQGRKIVTRLRYGYWPGRRRYRSGEFAGYVALNQPKYLPGDTLRVKAYVANRKGKPWRRPLELEIRERGGRYKTILQRDIAPVTPGAFVFEMPLADTLRLDQRYSVSFSEKTKRDDREPAEIGEIFYLEDYQLDEISYTLAPAAPAFRRGEPATLRLSARDANNLPAPDAAFKLVLLSTGADAFHASQVYVPDTLWRHEQAFSEETEIVVPDSIWPEADLNVDVRAYCTVSSGELQEKKVSFKVLRSPAPLNARLEQGFIRIDRPMAPATPDTVWLEETGSDGLTRRRPLSLPFREALQPGIEEYTVQSGTQRLEITLPDADDAVTNTAFCARDSVFLALDNPHRLTVRYQIYEDAKAIAEGTVTDSLWTWIRLGRQSRGLSYQYLWQGRTQRYFAEAICYDKLLDLELEQPETVQPGAQVQVKIRVKDAKQRPVAGANLTAGAYNRQFGQEKPYTEPEIEYRKIRWPFTLNNFKLKPAEAQAAQTPVTRTWYERLQLDSVLYYRLRYRGAGWYAETIPVRAPETDSLATRPEGLPWSLPYERDSFYRQRPQFAPHIIRANQAQPVYLIWCNSKLVYYAGASNTPPYSCYGWYGYNQVKIRTRDGEFTLDSLYLKAGEKLEFALDADVYQNARLPCKVRFESRPDTLTPFEQDALRRSMLLWRSSGDAPAHFFWNGPENIQAVYNVKGRAMHILGPFLPNETLYYLQTGAYLTSFKFEPGFEYDIDRGRERLYHSQWPKGATKLYRHLPARSPGELARGPHHLLVNVEKGPVPPKYQLQGRDAAGQASLQIRFGRTDTLLAIALRGDSLLGPFRPHANRLDGLPPGRYALLVYNMKGHLWRKDIALRRDTLLFLDAAGAEFRPAGPDEAFEKVFPLSWEPGKQNTSPSPFTQWPGAATGYNGISGILTDNTGEPLIGATVLVSQGGITVGGVITDVEGFYRIFLPPGNYDLMFQYTGYNSRKITGVSVAGNGLAKLDEQLESGALLQEVVITAYKVPLIQQDHTSGGKVITADALRRMPTRQVSGIAAKTAGLSVAEDVKIKGSRSAFAEKEEAPEDLEFPAGALRTRFRDYAYWQPNLITDPNGEAQFQVTFPDNITGWNTFTLAMDRRRRAGVATRNVRALKPLSAKLSLPRFAVAGDRFDAAGLTNNFSGDSAGVRTAFRLGGQLLRENRARIGPGLVEYAPVTVPAADSLHLSYEMHSANVSDGEERRIAILPVGTRETAGQFLVLERDTALTLTFDPALGPVTVQATDNVLDLLAGDIDYLRRYPYGCNEQTASRLLALLAEKKLSALPRKKTTTDAKNRAKAAALLEKEIKACLHRLLKGQLADGSWGWWGGGTPNAWMTVYVLRALREAQAAGYECPGIELGLVWLRREIGAFPLNDQREALLFLREADVQFDCTPYLARLDTLPRHSLYERLSHWRLQQRCGRPLPVDSLLSVLTPTTTGGRYCGEENTHWYNRRATNTLLAYDLAREAGWADITRGIRRYWLESRAAAQYRNTIETAQILQRLLPELLSGSDILRPNLLGVNGLEIKDFPVKWATPAGTTAVSLSKLGSTPLFVSVYQQWHNPDPAPRSDLFAVESWLEQGGRRADSLRRGEAAELVLRVQVHQTAEYALLEAPLPAGCSYGEKPSAIRPEVHREYFRDRVAIFFETLPAGRYECRIPLEPRFSGRFTLNPARLEQMYFPVFYGRNGVNVVNVF